MKKKIVNSLILPDWPRDKPLFKYLKKEYMDSFFNVGELRIGTLYDFRNQEQYGSNRGDEDEGKKEIYERINDITVEDPSKINPLSPFVKQYIKIENTAKNTRLSNCTFSQSHDSDNCYIYCMSKEFDEKFYEEFETEVCVKIKSPYKLVKCISKNFRDRANFLKLSPVKYGSRRQPYGMHDEYHASVIKADNYKHQKEVRSIWTPKDKSDITSVIIKVPVKCIKRFCEIFHKK